MCNLQITRPFTVQTPTIRYHRMTHRIKSYEETLYSASTGVGPTDTTSPNPPPPSVTMPLTLFQLHQLSPPLLDDAASPRRRLLPSPCRWPLLSSPGGSPSPRWPLLSLSARLLLLPPWPLLSLSGGSPSPRGLSSPLSRRRQWEVGRGRLGRGGGSRRLRRWCLRPAVPPTPSHLLASHAAAARRGCRRRAPRLAVDRAARFVADLCRFVDLLPLLLPRFV